MVAYSDELKPAGVMPLHYFGRGAGAVPRAGRGRPCARRPLPPLGAHLGHGGCVIENNITCPFHGWRFDGSGSCVGIPCAKKIPPAAMLRRWPVSEKNGMIFVYHAPEESYAPTWEVPALAEHESQAWTSYTRRRWRVRTKKKKKKKRPRDRRERVRRGPLLLRPRRDPPARVEGDDERAAVPGQPRTRLRRHPGRGDGGQTSTSTRTALGMFTRALPEADRGAHHRLADAHRRRVRRPSAFTFTVKRVPDESAAAFVTAAVRGGRLPPVRAGYRGCGSTRSSWPARCCARATRPIGLFRVGPPVLPGGDAARPGDLTG